MPEATTDLRPELARLSTYNAGLTLEDALRRCGGGPVAKLGSNENPYGQPAPVREAMQRALLAAHLYPDPQCRKLAGAIAAQSALPAGRIIFGDGSEDLLNILARCLLRPGDKMVTLYPSFPLHEDYARMMGADIIRIGLTMAWNIDMPALLAAAAAPARLILLANPMNPAGLWLRPYELDALLAAQHPQTVLCLDEAYMEYAAGADFLPATERLQTHAKPLLILRTFSKAYGLAALRVGYGLSNDEELLRGMNLVRTPFNVNGIAQEAAMAALRHQEEMRAAVSAVVAERERVAAALRQMGFTVLPSKGNFLFVDAARPSGPLAEALLDQGVIVKPWRQAGYETFLRVSIGLPRENEQFLDALRRMC